MWLQRRLSNYYQKNTKTFSSNLKGGHMWEWNSWEWKYWILIINHHLCSSFESFWMKRELPIYSGENNFDPQFVHLQTNEWFIIYGMFILTEREKELISFWSSEIIWCPTNQQEVWKKCKENKNKIVDNSHLISYDLKKGPAITQFEQCWLIFSVLYIKIRK